MITLPYPMLTTEEAAKRPFCANRGRLSRPFVQNPIRRVGRTIYEQSRD
jgi:hypothetical protein